MSTQVDSRVVEMRFDNRQFEKNCSDTISTLDKLKQKLRLDGASKGLENVNSAAKKVDMNGLGGAVETVRAKFSALEVMGVTALANITNSAVNAGKRIISALTLDPVKTGLSEYETKMNAIQVIQANTRTKNTMEDITTALEDLNVYADKTIYNFAQMTSNMGKFTAQGHNVYQAANAVKGLANLAAASGASAEDMARATYQMSQSMGGYIKLIDWNSLRNANMATQDLKNTLIDLAKVNGVAIDDMIKKHGTFEQTLSEGWLSGDMFTEAMNIYSGVYTDAELKAKGFNDKQIANFKELAAMAESAATEVKTFTQLWDVLKETAQSGWTQTWELIIGDFATAKKMLTDVQNYFSDIINGWSDIRNSLLGGALNLKNPWKGITDKLDKSGLGKIVEVAETIEDATEKLKKFQDVVNKVWRGDFGNVDTGRFEGLKEAGFDASVVQELVNKGLEYELTIEDVEEAHKKFGLTMDKNVTNTKKMTEVMGDLSEEKLRDAGLTEGEIRIYKALAKEAEKTGKSISEVAKEMSENDGRTMIIESIKNAWSGFVKILKSVRDAWEEVFPPMTIVQLYNGIKAVNKFSQHLKVSDETADKLRRTFKGVFAILDVITTILGGGLKIVLKIVTKLLEHFDLDILDVTAAIGDAAVKFRDFMDQLLDFTAIFDAIVGPIKTGIEAFRNWIDTLKDAENVPKAIAEGILSQFTWLYKGAVKALDQLVNFVKSGFKELPDFMKSGLINGVWEMLKSVGQVFVELGKLILEKIKGVLGIHSPSTEFFEIGKNIILGLVNGIKAGGSIVWNAIRGVGLKCIEVIKQIDFGTIFAGLMVGGALFTVAKLADAVSKLAAPFAGLGDMLEEIGDAAKDIGKGVKNYLNGKALLSLATAIAVLALAIVQLSKIDPGRLWATIGAVTALMVLIVGLTIVVSKFNTLSDLNVSPKAILSVLAIAGAMLMLSWALGRLASIDESSMKSTLIVFGALLVGMLVLSKACQGEGVLKMGGTLLAMAASLLILTAVMAIIGNLKDEAMLKGLIIIGLFELFVLSLTKIAGKNKTGSAIVKVGGTLLAMSFALLTLVAVFAIMDKLSPDAIKKGVLILTIFGVFIAALIMLGGMATKGRKSGSMIIKLGGMMLGIGFALLAFAGVIAILDKIGVKSILKGVAVLVVLGTLMAIMTKISKGAGKNVGKTGLMLMAMSAAMLLLVGVIYIISLLKPEALIKGVAVVTALGLMMSLLLFVSKNAGKSMGAIIAITVALTMLVAAIVVLSFMDPSQIAPAVVAVSMLLLTFSLLMKAMGEISKAKSVWKSITVMLVVLGTLAAIVWLMGVFDTKNALNNALGLSALLVAMATSMKILNNVSRINKSPMKAMYSLIGVAAGAALVLALMGALKPDNAIVNAIALGIFMNAMASSLKILNKVTTSKTAIPGMFAMAGVAAIAGIVLAIMSGLKTDNAIVNAIALGIFMNTMATALKIMNKVSTNKTAIKGMLVMSGCAAIAGLVLAMMSGLKTKKAITNAIALGIFMNAMATALFITSKVKMVSTNALVALGAISAISTIAGLVLAMMSALKTDKAITNAIALGIFMNTMATALFITQFAAAISVPAMVGLAAMVGIAALAGLVLAMMSGLQCDNAIQNAIALGVLINALSIAMIICSVAGVVAGAALPGLGMLALFIVGLGVLIGAIGALVTYFPQLEEFLNKGIPILEKIGYALGSFVGNIVGGLLESMSDCLPKIGENLSGFATNMSPFIQAIKNIDSDSTEGIKHLAEAMLILASAELVDAATFWSNDTSLTKFGKELAKFGPYVKQYSDSVKGIDVAAVTASADATKAIASVVKELPNSGGLWGLIAGENDMNAFGTMLEQYGVSLMKYANTVSGLTEEHVGSINRSVTVTKALNEMAAAMPNSGGLWGLIAGNNDMDVFGAQLSAYGASLATYAETVAYLTDDGVAAIERSVTVTKLLNDMAASLPSSGGIISWFTGNNDMDDFGIMLASYGESLKTFANSVSGLTDDNIAAIEASVTASKDLSELANSLPDSGGIASWFSGDNSLSSFGSVLSSYGSSLVSYANSVSSLNTDSIEVSVTATKKIVAALPTGDYSGIGTFSNNLKSLAKSLKSYSQIDSSGMSGITTEVESLITLATEAAGKDFSGLSTLTTSLGKLGEEGVNKFVSSFDGASDKMTNVGESMMNALITAITLKYARFIELGKLLIDGLKRGITIQKVSASTECTSLVSSAADKIREYRSSFESAGSYVASGFVAGIRGKINSAANAAAAMASAAITAAKRRLDEHSPSKVFEGIGSFAGEGLVLGLNKSEDSAYDAGTDLGTSATDGMTAAVSSLSDMLSTDIESITPTITPVIDSSNVDSWLSGIKETNIDLGGGIVSSLNGLSADINASTSNSNDDIVDKLDELIDVTASADRSTYNINGVTYSANSELDDAVRIIVRAAKVERRR